MSKVTEKKPEQENASVWEWGEWDQDEGFVLVGYGMPPERGLTLNEPTIHEMMQTLMHMHDTMEGMGFERTPRTKELMDCCGGLYNNLALHKMALQYGETGYWD